MTGERSKDRNDETPSARLDAELEDLLEAVGRVPPRADLLVLTQRLKATLAARERKTKSD